MRFAKNVVYAIPKPKKILKSIRKTRKFNHGRRGRRSGEGVWDEILDSKVGCSFDWMKYHRLKMKVWKKLKYIWTNTITVSVSLDFDFLVFNLKSKVSRHPTLKKTSVRKLNVPRIRHAFFFISWTVVHGRIIFQGFLPAFTKFFECEYDSEYFRKSNQIFHWSWQSYIFNTRLNHQFSCGTDFVGLSKKTSIWSCFFRNLAKRFGFPWFKKNVCVLFSNDVLVWFLFFWCFAYVLQKIWLLPWNSVLIWFSRFFQKHTSFGFAFINFVF